MPGSAGRSSRAAGPVLTIGEIGAETPPTVAIRDVTVTGGRTTSSPESLVFTGQEGVLAVGGGIDIPPGGPIDTMAPPPLGATVTLTRTTVTANAAAPSATAPFGPPCPGATPARSADRWRSSAPACGATSSLARRERRCRAAASSSPTGRSR